MAKAKIPGKSTPFPKTGNPPFVSREFDKADSLKDISKLPKKVKPKK